MKVAKFLRDVYRLIEKNPHLADMEMSVFVENYIQLGIRTSPIYKVTRVSDHSNQTPDLFIHVKVEL